METNIILEGDCLLKLKDLPNESVDAIVTDPPYGLKFMGKSWDYDVPSVEIWKECFRVLKSGGHLLSFSGTRTYHRMACNIEDAGFEIRDMISWIYGSGFPKSMNIGKAVDKLQGNEREWISESPFKASEESELATQGKCQTGRTTHPDITKGTSEWEGWGTTLKPACEPIVLARKPISEKTIALNVLKYGTGGLNIDECRIGNEPIKSSGDKKSLQIWKENDGRDKKDLDLIENTPHYNNGRFPANIIHDGSDEVLSCFPNNKGAFAPVKSGQKGFGGIIYGKYKTGGDDGKTFYGDGLGSASRFFYCAKAGKEERNFGLEQFEEKQAVKNFIDGANPDYINSDGSKRHRKPIMNKNNHPTVKPLALMKYLVKLITPKNGIVLDPFSGSGTTLISAKLEGYNFIGIEMEPEYIKIARARLEAY